MSLDKTHFLFSLLIFVLLCAITDIVVRIVERRLMRKLAEEKWAFEKEFDKLITPCIKELECNSGNIDTLIITTNEFDENLRRLTEHLEELEKWQHEVDKHLLKLTDGYYGKLIEIEEDKMI